MGKRAVLLDWRGTLVCDPEDTVWLQAAATQLGRDVDLAETASLTEALSLLAARPEYALRLARCDISGGAHRSIHMELFEAAGMDEEFASELYELDFEPTFHPFFPDVAPALAALHDHEIRIVVASNIHFDIRPEFVRAGLDDFVDGYALSFEHGVQKPEPAFFELALDMLDVRPEDTLMVGDDPRLDGAAASVGILTLLLPPLRECVPRGLDMVVKLVA
jgi:HAD superfamily hydrolase (TIGR01549 family)